MAIVVLISGKAEKCLELRDLDSKTEMNGTVSSHSPYVFYFNSQPQEESGRNLMKVK